MRQLWMAASVIVLALVIGVRAEEKRTDSSKLVGTWTVTSKETDGKQAAATELKGAEVKVTRDTITCTGKNGKAEMTCRYEVDTSAKPWKITMNCTEGEHKGKKLQGIAELNGDTLKVCFAKPDGETPTKFETKENQCCMTLKRSEK